MSSSIFFEPHPLSLLQLNGRDSIPLLQRMSTNDLHNLSETDVKATIFLNAKGRVLERVYVRPNGVNATLFLQENRDRLLQPYLQRNVFFRDDVTITKSSDWYQIYLFGSDTTDLILSMENEIPMPDIVFTAIGNNSGWNIFCTSEVIDSVINIIENSSSMVSRGDSTLKEYYRVITGLPAAGTELTPDFIPLELGLWDDISFTKGCYVGQEIIARMESRRQLARILVSLELSGTEEVGTIILHQGKRIGVITSVAHSRARDYFALSIIQRKHAKLGNVFNILGSQGQATIHSIPGNHPDWVLN